MKKGTTFLEILVIIAVLGILFAVFAGNVHPEENRKKARDAKRLADLMTLDRAIIEYRLTNNVYPGAQDVLRVSTSLPPTSTELFNAKEGWIGADISEYSPKMPVDPTNDATYFYSYIHDKTSYELNAKMEIFLDTMINDGGNDPNMYEIGNNLILISP
jgi:type II secretory pathway pseudopilin PulG